MPAITIGNAQGFWGDSAEAPSQLLYQYPDLDFLTLDYLTEVSMSILSLQRDLAPELGYVREFVEVVRSLIPHWRGGSAVRVVCNAGGLNPEGCAQACNEVLREAGLHRRVGVVTGDDVLPELQGDPDQRCFHHAESGRPLREVLPHLLTANAYIGGRGIARVLEQGADIVITGRVADPSLVTGICAHAHGWAWDDLSRIAQATVGGHLIEGGVQVCGGASTHWLEMPEPANMGFPVLVVEASGEIALTKPPGTGGVVSERTVKEQLLQGLGDPEHYQSPDCSVDFTTLRVRETERDVVRITGATGAPSPEMLKVGATYRDGFWASGALTIFGRDALAKAQRCGEMVLDRLRDAGYTFERTQVEFLGANAVAPDMIDPPTLLETVLRVSVADPRREAVERFTREFAPLMASGPQGITGFTSGRPGVRPAFGFWPCLIPRDRVGSTASVLK